MKNTIIFQLRINHIIHHFIQELDVANFIEMKFCSTNDQVANDFTKVQSYIKIIKFHELLGMKIFVLSLSVGI